MPARPCISIATISVALCAHAFAQNPAAETLFNDGEKLMQQGKVAQACDAFAASNRIEARAGTLLSLGQCREQNLQLASAWSAYKDALGRAKDPKKKKYAADRIAALEHKLSQLTIAVVAGNRVDGLTITRNGALIDSALWNRAEPIDGGDYEVVATAPNHAPWKSIVTVPTESGKINVAIPKLEVVAQPPQEPPQEPPRQQPPPKPRPAIEIKKSEPARELGPWTTKRKVAVGVFAVAAGSLATGIALGVSAKHHDEQALAMCTEGVPCAQAAQARALNLDAHRLAIGADVLFGVAGVATLGAAVLWITGAPRSVDVVPTGTGIAVVGWF